MALCRGGRAVGICEKLMRILWLNSGLLPRAVEALGDAKSVTSGWLGSMQEALLQIDSTLEMCALCLDHRPCDVKIGNVRYVSFGERGKTWYKKVPRSIELQCKRVIEEFSPDVIHVQGTEYFYGCMSEDVYCGKPVVVSIQGVISGCHPHFTGGLTPAETWWTKLNLRLLRYGATFLREQTFWREKRAVQEAKTIRQQRYFIGRTEWDEAWVRYFNPKAKYFHVNETLREPFYLVRRDRKAIKPHTIYCSAAAGYALKGAHWLLRAVAALKNEFPDIQLRIVAAKDKLDKNRSFMAKLKDDAYGMYLRRLVRDLGIENNVVALPALPAEGVAEELKNAELFVLPSLCENSPNSLGEAMLVGTPAIATFVGGTPSILKDGIEGKLVPSCDPAALAEAIRRWFMHPEEAEACVALARATALARHDGRRNAKETLAVYETISTKLRV